METQMTHNNIRYIDEGQFNEVKVKGENFYEEWMLKNIQKLPYRRGLWLDIGAHVGNHAIFFSNHCKADEVWAYEPTESTFEVLKENVKNNCKRTVRLFKCAIGAKKGYCTIKENECPGQNRVLKKKGNTKMEVIGDIVATVALVKIDVEGMERDVIKGAMPILERDRPELFIESFEPMEVILRLLPEGYKFIHQYNNAPTFHFSCR